MVKADGIPTVGRKEAIMEQPSVDDVLEVDFAIKIHLSMDDKVTSIEEILETLKQCAKEIDPDAVVYQTGFNY